MDQNQTSAQVPKAQILSFPYRRTGMGGFDDSVILSFRTKKPVKSILRTSRSGNHGTRSYRLFPAKYLLYSVKRSNGGNLYGTISIISISENGELKTETEWQVYNREPVMTLSDLPADIRNILILNKDVLPLWNRVFPFDYHEDRGQDNQEEE